MMPPVPPAVSILLPVRDAAVTLPACLRSIARQTFTDFECVVVDDGSRDGSPDLVHALAARDGRFRLVRRPAAGLVAALHAGVEACRGELVARMDGDDLMHRQRLAAQVAALGADPALAAVGCHVRCIPRAGLREGRLLYEAWLNDIRDADAVRVEALVECPLAHPTWMLRREVLRAFPYRELPWPEDYDLLLRLLAAGRSVGVVPRRLLAWRDRPNRLSRTHPRYGLDRFVQAKVHHLCAGVLAHSSRYVLWGYGATGRRLARALLAFGRTPAAIVELHAGRVGNRILGAPVIRPAELARHRGVPLLVSVAGSTPRTEIRGSLRALGYLEPRDFVCVA